MSSDTLSRADARPTPMDDGLQHHTLARILGLHLLPGVLATAVYVVVAPWLMRLGFPALLAAYVVVPGVVIPCELGYLLVQARRAHGRPSLRDVVHYREAIPAWQYAAFVPLLLVWAMVASGLLMPLDAFLAGSVFAALPDWFVFGDLPAYPTVYSRTILVATMVIGLVVNGLAGPVVEELFFRGYLLPRLARFGRWAPLLNVVLFSLYHFWTPWQLVSRIAVLVPMVYAVWWKRNIYLGMITHCTLNSIGLLLTFWLLLS